MDNTRPTWAEIDLSAIRRNIDRIKQVLAPKTGLMIVVKANAYGHGMAQVARTSLTAGADCLAVATLDEAISLREEGIEAPILVLGCIHEVHAETAVAYNVDVTVFDLRTALALSQAASARGKTAHIHIKLDTGMGRIGFPVDVGSIEIIQQIYRLPGIVIRGVFSHFATADHQDKSFAMEQLKLFDNFVNQLENAGVKIPIKHLANSAGIMDLPVAHFNMARAGIITYGLYPSNEVNRKRLQLEPAMRLLTRISYLKTIPEGSSVSYGRTFIAQRETRVATVPIGYADGYPRLLSNQAWATIRGQRVPLIGNVCMDQCMFDVTDVENSKEGDEVVLFGRPEDGITADDLADLIGTINYEIVCSPSGRVPRIYIG